MLDASGPRAETREMAGTIRGERRIGAAKPRRARAAAALRRSEARERRRVLAELAALLDRNPFLGA